MLVHRLARRALIRVVRALHAADLSALLIVDIINFQGISLRNRVGNTEQLGGPVVSLYRLTFGARLVQFAAYVHAFVGEQIQTIELCMGCAARMAQVSHQGAAPRFLNGDSAGPWVGVTGCEHLGVEHRIEQSVAMNFGRVIVGQLGCFHG
jgi:hypothetical protein